MQAVDDAERSLALAEEAFARFDVEGLILHLSAAIRGFTAADDPCRAAMACARMGEVMVNALGNLTAGRAWFARADRLVEGLPPCLEQGWVAVAAMGCDVDDPAHLLARAELALDRARRFGDLNLECKALADAGLAHVQSGRIPEGMALLDEAMALACGPADDTDTSAKSVCSFFTACYHAFDLERAGSWADLLRQRGLIGPEPGGPAFLSSHCDSVQATLLMEMGRWSEAEEVLLRARAEFESAMGGLPAWHPDLALADLRIHQGRLADAEALLLGKDQSIQALLPAARLHLARGDHRLALANARRGLRAIADDRLRAVELLTVTVDAHLGAGDLDGARAARDALADRAEGLQVAGLRARSGSARARVQAAEGDPGGAVVTLEAVLDDVGGTLPWLSTTLHLDLARLHEQAGDDAAARLTAGLARAALAHLDVELRPDHVALLDRLDPLDRSVGRPAVPAETAALFREGSWWVASCGGTSARLQSTKGLAYLAELVAVPGAERHALDLVDRIEGVGVTGEVDRHALGDAGELLDTRARTAYRHRIEELRATADEALDIGDLEAAEAAQAEVDLLVLALAQAFGLGGRSRVAASAAERARLNVTRAIRAALTRLTEALPGPGAALDRGIRTGTYCSYAPAPDDVRWIVQPGLNEIR
jgi:hypothetical protein